MRSLLLAFLVLALACGDDSSAIDGGTDVGATPDAATSDAATADVGGDDAGGEDAAPGMDAGLAIDGGPGLDARPAMDAGGDTGTDAGSDAGTDAGSDAGADAGSPDAGAACHDYTYGQPTVSFERVDSLPTMVGGEIPRGVYDAVQVRTTGTVSGRYRGTWVFEDDATLQTLEQITITGDPPALTPRTQSYQTVGTSLRRRRTCPESGDFDNQYQVRAGAAAVFLDIRQGTVVFTYQLRE